MLNALTLLVSNFVNFFLRLILNIFSTFYLTSKPLFSCLIQTFVHPYFFCIIPWLDKFFGLKFHKTSFWAPVQMLVLESKFLSFKTPFRCEGLFPENCKKTPSKIIAWKFCPEIPDKTNLAGNSKAKNQDQQWKFHFLLVTLGNSTSFLINPCKFHMLFL